MDTTLDGLLDRRVMLEQPAKGYRIAIDTVFLAAAVPAHAGERVLDLGCGVGGAMLCLACRVPGVRITGVEIQPQLAELARRNIARNKFPAEMKIIQGDVTHLSANAGYGKSENSPPFEGEGIHAALSASFDHVMMNPPYHAEAQHDVSSDAIKRAANTEKEGDLMLWLTAAAKSLRAHGTLTLIHRADRLDEILALAAAAGFGGMRVMPILPRLGAFGSEDKRGRILLRAQRDTGGEAVRYRPFIIHQPVSEGGKYSDAAEGILRHMKPVDFP